MRAALTHRYHLERIEGVDREKPTPKKLHIRIQNGILALMFEAVKLNPAFEAMPELDTLLETGKDFLVLDIVVTHHEADVSQRYAARPRRITLHRDSVAGPNCPGAFRKMRVVA